MALFKIFKGTDISKLTNPAHEEYIPLKDGYCYFDTTTGLFFIDAEVVKEDGTTEIVRAPINANRAIYDVYGNKIDEVYLASYDFNPTNLGIAYCEANVGGNGFSHIASIPGFVLRDNSILFVRFADNVQMNSMLLINDNGLKPIYFDNIPISNDILKAGDIGIFVYTNNRYELLGIHNDIVKKANLNSPNFSGIPTVPTPADGDSSTQIANTQFITDELTKIIDGASEEYDTLKKLEDQIKLKEDQIEAIPGELVPFPTNVNNFYHSTGTWGGADSLTYTATANGGAPALVFTLPTASVENKGVLSVGDNLTINNGVISLTKQNIIKALDNISPLDKNSDNYAAGDSPNGNAIKAISDQLGNIINETYMPITGGTFTGPVIFNSNSAVQFKSTIQLNEASYGITLPENGIEGQLFYQICDTENNSGDYVTIQTEQNIIGQKTFLDNIRVTREGNEHSVISLKVSDNGIDKGIFDETYNKWIIYSTQDTNGNIIANTDLQLYGAVWNDYAEYRVLKNNNIKINDLYGHCVIENGDDTVSLSTQRLQPAASIISDTFGIAIGKINDEDVPLAIAGRVLAYMDRPASFFKVGDAVCAGKNGTLSKMSRREIRKYPDRIVGIVSSIPNYEYWGPNNILVNNRIWIKIGR